MRYEDIPLFDILEIFKGPRETSLKEKLDELLSKEVITTRTKMNVEADLTFLFKSYPTIEEALNAFLKATYQPKDAKELELLKSMGKISTKEYFQLQEKIMKTKYGE